MHDKNQNAAEAWLRMRSRMGSQIKVYSSVSGDDTAGRIELSDGTRAVDARETAGPNAYEQGAMVPRQPWRQPTRDELDDLATNEIPGSMAGLVAVVRLPGDFSPAKRDQIRTGAQEAIEANLIRPLQKICEFQDPFHCIGPNRNPPGLETVTFNDRIGLYNGLHVDGWDQLDINSLHLATNRVCVNIGEGDRYFLFLPFSVQDIARLLSQEMGAGWKLPERTSLIGRQFMERFPDIPVIRCRVAPGEAYIAPTENLVHDGSSAGQSADDEQFTLRGHIRLLSTAHQ